MPSDLHKRTSKAIAHFWRTRDNQSSSQGRTSRQRDRGSRTAVTGGKQLDGFVELVGELVCEAGVQQADVSVERRSATLPGFFRPTKQWDIVLKSGAHLLATIEFKSQVGPSFGNNFNNRTEEAVGSAHDFWTAFRDGAFLESPRPWLGYLMLLEDCEQANRPVAVEEPHFPVFSEFKGASYAQRYRELCRRLVGERLYDATCLILSPRDTGKQGEYSEPDSVVGVNRFAASLTAHIAAHVRFHA